MTRTPHHSTSGGEKLDAQTPRVHMTEPPESRAVHMQSHTAITMELAKRRLDQALVREAAIAKREETLAQREKEFAATAARTWAPDGDKQRITQLELQRNQLYQQTVILQETINKTHDLATEYEKEVHALRRRGRELEILQRYKYDAVDLLDENKHLKSEVHRMAGANVILHQQLDEKTKECNLLRRQVKEQYASNEPLPVRKAYQPTGRIRSKRVFSVRLPSPPIGESYPSVSHSSPTAATLSDSETPRPKIYVSSSESSSSPFPPSASSMIATVEDMYDEEYPPPRIPYAKPIHGHTRAVSDLNLPSPVIAVHRESKVKPESPRSALSPGHRYIDQMHHSMDMLEELMRKQGEQSGEGKAFI